jgi:hypothetical protein
MPKAPEFVLVPPYPPHPEIAKQMGVAGNPNCICPTPMQAMFCPYGHMLECHYPRTCREARCQHFLRDAGEE